MASADSIAMVELSHERSFATDQWLRPVQNAFSYGTVLTVFLADHLASLAASCTAPRIGPSFSFLTTIRPIVESAPVAHWLLDPHTTVMHRVQRGLAYRWDSAVNLKRNSHLVEATTNAVRRDPRLDNKGRIHQRRPHHRRSGTASPRNGLRATHRTERRIRPHAVELPLRKRPRILLRAHAGLRARTGKDESIRLRQCDTRRDRRQRQSDAIRTPRVPRR
jgi:hypothetical protein